MITVDWENIDPEFKYFSIDKNGYSYLYIDKPMLDGYDWYDKSCTWKSTGNKHDGDNWWNSLQERPATTTTTTTMMGSMPITISSDDIYQEITINNKRYHLVPIT